MVGLGGAARGPAQALPAQRLGPPALEPTADEGRASAPDAPLPDPLGSWRALLPWVSLPPWPLDPAATHQRPDPPPAVLSARRRGTPATPGSDPDCVARLAAEGVAFELADPTEGVATPVRVDLSDVGGVAYRYYYPAPPPRVLDCRLALALARAAPVLRANGVRAVVFASHYRPSLGLLPPHRYHPHAQGLALDVKGFEVGDGVRLDVTRDYEPGLGFQTPASCLGRPVTAKGMLLRKIVCDLDAADVFFAILTPDYDAEHWNHLHLGAFHPAQALRVRSRNTALFEVPLDEMPRWARRRPPRHRPALRRWDQVAARPWPRPYLSVREAFGVAAPPAAVLVIRRLLRDPSAGPGWLHRLLATIRRLPESWGALWRPDGSLGESRDDALVGPADESLDDALVDLIDLDALVGPADESLDDALVGPADESLDDALVDPL